MGISNTIPPSRLIQPGVCTSSTRPTSPFEGQTIFETDTDRMYVWNGSTWVIPNSPAQNPTGLEYISSITISGQTSLSFTSLLTSNYDNYRVVFSPTARQTAAQNQINLRVRSGSTDLSTGSLYQWGRTYYYAGGSGFSGNVADNSINMADSNAGYVAINFDLIAPKLAQETFVIGQTSVSQVAGGPFLFGINWSGFVNNTTSYDGLSLIGTSTFSGTAKLYGYRNS